MNLGRNSQNSIKLTFLVRIRVTAVRQNDNTQNDNAGRKIADSRQRASRGSEGFQTLRTLSFSYPGVSYPRRL